MPPLIRRLLPVSLPLGLVLACSAPSKGALVLAISTDMQVPKDVDVVTVYITTNGAPRFDYAGRVLPDGTVSFPSTLAVVEPPAQGAQVRIRVIGFKTRPAGDANARVLRDILTTVPHARTALMRIPLDFLDDGSGIGTMPADLVPLGPGGAPEGDTTFDPTSVHSKCGTTMDSTSIDGACVSAVVDSSMLPDYDPTAVFGDGGALTSGMPSSCFDVATCFGGATLVAGAGSGACSIPVPSGVDPSTLNVAFVSADTGVCLGPAQCYVPLPEDASLGWALQGGSVQLAPPACAKLGSNVGVAVSAGACAAKVTSLPVCQPGETPGADAGVDATGDALPRDATVDGLPPDAGADATLVDAVSDGPRPACVQDTDCVTAGDFCSQGACVHLTAIAVGLNHTCAVTSSGGVQCWGDNGAGELGTGTNGGTSDVPVPVVGLSSPAVAVAAGNTYSCAVLATGTVECWGDNTYGELGTAASGPSAATPVTIAGLAPNITGIVGGKDFVCALDATGGVACWGGNASGELGNGTNMASPTPVTVTGLSTGVKAIASGDAHACAVTSVGAVSCWGDNASGQLGTSSQTMPSSNVPVSVASLASGVTGVAAGKDQSCAVAPTGVSCWGGNTWGDLGSAAATPTPTPVQGLQSGTEVGAGGYVTCARTAAGGVMCWGDNGLCQLGDGACLNGTTQTPVGVSGLAGAQAIAIGANHSCALLSGRAMCWGSDGYGQLGDGASTWSATPLAVSGLASGVTSIAAGGNHTCATEASGVVCWGDNVFGDLGNGKGTLSTAPVSVMNLAASTQVVSGGAFSCAVTSAGSLECWGSNNGGQLGDGTMTDRNTPVAVKGLPQAPTAIAAGWVSACALVQGTVYCWGVDTAGQLGNGALTPPTSPTPVAANLNGPVIAIAMGDYFGCAATQSGATMECWGDDTSGQLGNHAMTSVPSPTPGFVSGLASTVQAVAAGGRHVCALEPGGVVQCWGENTNGQVGDGTTTNRNAPVTVALPSPALSVAAGAVNTCAVMSDHTLECWGASYGPVPTPVLVNGVANVTVGSDHTCVLTQGGSVLCWGDDSFGQLGTGKPTGATPVGVTEP